MQQQDKAQEPTTRQIMADELKMSYSTFKRWLKRENIELPKGLITPAYQKLIYEKFYNRISE